MPDDAFPRPDPPEPRAALDETTLRSCPFCGGRAVVERHPWLTDGIRIACGNDACPITPATEVLLACYASELRAAWNTRIDARACPRHRASA